MGLSKIALLNLYTSCVLFSSVCVQAKSTLPYNGVSAGLNTGMMITSTLFPDRSKRDANGKIIVQDSPFYLNCAQQQYPVGLHLDYHTSEFKEDYQYLYLGLGLNVGTALSDTHKTLLSGNGRITDKYNPNGQFNLNGTVTFKQKRKFYAELTPKVGVRINDFIIYALCSVRYSSLESTLSVTNDIRKNGILYLAKGNYIDKVSNIGLAPGVGVDTKISQRWSLGVEYKHFFEKNLKFAKGQEKASSSAQNLFLVRASYHF